jgi:putative spermidine/putrescine transport system substrate-binding protein
MNSMSAPRRRCAAPASVLTRMTASVDAMRRAARRTCSALVVVLACGQGLPAPAHAADAMPFQGVTLRVGTWGGATRDAMRDFVAAEVEKRGGRVEFVIGSPQDNFAKVIASRGRPAVDVLNFQANLVPEILGRDLLARLNRGRLANVRALPSDKHDDLMVATWNTQEMIVYNKDKFREHDLPPPESLADLRNPKLAGRVLVPDISSGAGIEAVGAFALTAGGNEQDIEPGLRLIREIPGVRFWRAGGEVVTQFKSGDIWAAVAHAGWAVRTAHAGVPVGAVPARIGNRRGIVAEAYMGVVKGTPHQEAAEFFIDTMVSADAQYEFAVRTGIVPVNPQARSRLAGVPVVRDLVVLDPRRIGEMVRLDPARIDLRRWNEQWNRMLLQ